MLSLIVSFYIYLGKELRNGRSLGDFLCGRVCMRWVGLCYDWYKFFLV